MWNGNPREARRAARYAARAARQAARYARRGTYYPYRYRYGRPGGGIFGLLVLLFLLLYLFSHIWVWLVMGLIALVIVGAILRMVRAGTNYQQPPFVNYQQPPQPYQPYMGPQPQNQTYEQGYAGPPPSQDPYAEGNQQYYYPPQVSDEQPQAQYPEQMPPMQ